MALPLLGKGGLIHGLTSTDKSLYGSKPVVPTLDYRGSYAKTIADNAALAPAAGKLAGQTNQINLDNLNELYRQVFPKRDAINKNIVGGIESRSRGEIPEDVSNAVSNSSAVKALAGGFGGSGMHRNLTARDLGMTSYGMQREAQGDMDSFMNTLMRTSMPQSADVRDYAINPEQRTQNEWDQDWLKSQVASAPDPGVAGRFGSELGLLKSL